MAFLFRVNYEIPFAGKRSEVIEADSPRQAEKKVKELHKLATIHFITDYDYNIVLIDYRRKTR